VGKYLLPYRGEILKITQETGSNLNIKTFRIRLKEEEERKKFKFLPGQFVELTVFGVGEAPFGFASSPTQEDYFDISIKETGLVTEAIHNMKEGDEIGIRGPYGNSFPYEEVKGKNLVFLAGGIGLAPLRSLINYVLDEKNRDQYGRVQMLLAFRSPEDMLYKYDFSQWEKSPNTTVKYTIDEECEGWVHCVGYPHELLNEELDLKEPDTVFFTCGPPIMIRFITDELKNSGIDPRDIITTLEMKMSCGLGKCGRCNIGRYYVCKDGPVFDLKQLEKMPAEF